MASVSLPRPIDSLHRRHGDPQFHVDWSLIVVTLSIAAFGILNIYAARRQFLLENNINEFRYVKKQLIAIGLGAIGASIVAAVDYQRWREFAAPLFAATTALLAAVPFLGVYVSGARAWFEFGGFQAQPSEFAKVTLVLAIAAYASLGRGSLGAKEFAYAVMICAIPAFLTMLQPDLGTTLVFGAVLMSVLLVAGARFRHIVAATLLGVALTIAVLGTNTLKDYQVNRLSAFIDQSTPSKKAVSAQEKNLEAVKNNIRQSQTAIATGGLTGEGYLNGSQTNGKFVPEQHTDFIFSAVGEQFGILGGAGLLALYSFLFLRIWRIAQLSRDLFGTLLCAGAIGWMVFQVFESIGMTMGIMPVTGIPLPLMSYGGSSTIAFMVLLGLVQNVHMRRYS